MTNQNSKKNIMVGRSKSPLPVGNKINYGNLSNSSYFPSDSIK